MNALSKIIPAMNSNPSASDSLPSPAAIAAAIRKPAKLQAAERQVSVLNLQRTELQDGQKTLINQLGGPHADTAGRRINQLQVEREAIECRLIELRRAMAPARDEYAAAVADALEPMMAAAADNILSAVAQMRAAIGLMNEAGAIISQAGGEPPQIATNQSFGALIGGVGWLEQEAERMLRARRNHA